MDPLEKLLTDVRRQNVSGARSRYGDCELVSDEFLAEARKLGLAGPDDYIVWGYRAFDPSFAARRHINDKEGQHQWVVIDGKIYDGTSDQFSDDEVTIARVSDSRYREHRRMHHTFRKAEVAERVASRFLLRSSYFSPGDLVLYGKYKNHHGKIVSFGADKWGNPTVEIEPVPKGRKQNKVFGLFKIWRADVKEKVLREQAKKVAARFLASLPSP
jgi:hypothetical protein